MFEYHSGRNRAHKAMMPQNLISSGFSLEISSRSVGPCRKLNMVKRCWKISVASKMTLRSRFRRGSSGGTEECAESESSIMMVEMYGKLVLMLSIFRSFWLR